MFKFWMVFTVWIMDSSRYSVRIFFYFLNFHIKFITSKIHLSPVLSPKWNTIIDWKLLFRSDQPFSGNKTLLKYNFKLFFPCIFSKNLFVVTFYPRMQNFAAVEWHYAIRFTEIKQLQIKRIYCYFPMKK